MIQVVYDWMKNIILFMVGMTIILNLISKSSYKKYIKFIYGILLILFILKPIINIIDNNKYFDFFLKSHEYKMDAGDIYMYLEDAEEIKNSAVINEYKHLLAEQTEKLLNAKGLTLKALDIEFKEEYGSRDFGQVNRMNITAGYKKEDADEVKVMDIVIEKVIISIGEDNLILNQNENNKQGSSMLEINVKNIIADFYNLDVSHINIIIQEDNNG